ncbi:uncharacterized protein At4g26450 isoform X2 [Mercurialis annua]|uniref:uncharacterized protein At4g26450 isoform X2 n=1 Tax=Mercurialis annua TaxID=3986 RepID=UPI0024ACEEE4|nr:uncharacterized protein At4g26450 isoform X2 [Mercurialis annua]
MHARHRNPGNGYRSNSMGMGMGGSRISPDNSARGRGFYNSEYRSFNNRGFGRAMGHPKSFQQPPQPPPRRGDILMEAGRLAAEYLVSKGLLPQDAVSCKWQNGDSKKHVVGDSMDIRLQDEFNQEGRTSAHSRLGSGASDAGIGRRRYFDDFNLRNNVKGRRRGEYFNRNYSSEWGGREYGRSATSLDRNRVSPDVEGEDDTVSGHYDDQHAGEDVCEGMQTSGLNGSVPESGEAAGTNSSAEFNNSDEMGSKTSSFSGGKDEPVEPCKPSDDSSKLISENDVKKDSNDKHEIDKLVGPKDLFTQESAVEGELSGKHGSDLLTLCNFAKVPTRTRSAMTYKVSKVDQAPNAEEGNVSDGSLKGSEMAADSGSLDFATAYHLANTNDSKIPAPEISKTLSAHSAGDVGKSGSTSGTGQIKCMRSQSFPDRAFMLEEQQSSSGVPGFGRSISIKERGEKRAAEESDAIEATKKPREWFASLVNTRSDHLQLSSPSQNQGSSQERASTDQQVSVAASQGSLVNCHQFVKTGGDSCNEHAEEKQLFPSSFKICDLNLMEVSEMNDSLCNDAILMHPTIAISKTEAAQVDIGLSMSNANLTDVYPRYANSGKNIEVIDLENDSIPEERDFDISQRKETAFSGPEGFPNRAQNAGEDTDVQDNYDGLISEFLTTISNTSEPEDTTPLQNEIGLHNGEGTLGDDDSIYMSLGEIPLSLRREHPDLGLRV